MGIRKPYLYEVGEIVNDTLRIVEKIRMKCGKYTQKGYIVQSTVYLNSTPYEIRESHLKEGIGCGYKRGLKVCDENSLWSVDSVRGNIIDIKQAKNVTKYSNKKMHFKCSTCNITKNMSIFNLVRNGFACPNCSINRSYPERFFTAYLKYYFIKYDYQVKFDDLQGFIFDYKIMLNNEIYLIETHGEQHYLKNHNWYTKTHNADKTKKNYAKKNNINYIELDCRKSDFEFIVNQINNNKYLPNIKKEDEKDIIELIKQSSKYNIQEIIKLYTIDKLTTYDIAEKYNLSSVSVGNILTRNNIKLRDGGTPKHSVVCVETDVIYNSISEAVQDTNIPQGNISNCCLGKRKTAGGYHWKFID